jgi:hypothetical protein
VGYVRVLKELKVKDEAQNTNMRAGVKGESR